MIGHLIAIKRALAALAPLRAPGPPMHLKFLAHGTGSARNAANYLLGERDAAGKPREGVEVLRGDPNEVADVADSLDVRAPSTRPA